MSLSPHHEILPTKKTENSLVDQKSRFEMRSPFQVMNDWAEDEGAELMSFLKRYYGPLPQISLIFPSWKPSMRLVTISMFILYTILIGAHIVLLVFSMVQAMLEWSLELASLCFHFSLLFIFGVFTMLYIQYQRSLYVRIHEIMAGDVGQYMSGRIYDDDWYVEEEKRMRKETIYYLGVPGAIGIVFGYIMFGPYISNRINGMENPYTPRMINAKLPLPCWYPFQTHEGALHVVAVVGQVVTAGCVSIIIVQVLLLLLINTQRIRLEMRVIGYSLETLFSRAAKVFLRTYPDQAVTDIRIRNPTYQRIVEKCLIDSIIHHHAVGELISIYAQQLDVPGGIALSIGTAVIALSLFNILEALKTNTYTSVTMFGLMIICETMVMFVVSSLGEAVTDESIKLRDQLYFVKWHDLDTINRKVLLNFHTAMTEPVVVRAMGLVDLSLDTFSSIMNMAYSFFNLMNAQAEEE